MSVEAVNIQRVPEPKRLAALGRLMLDTDQLSDAQSERVAALAEMIGLSGEHLWAAYEPRTDAATAVALILPRPGRTGMLFVSRPRRRADAEVLTQTVRRAVSEVPPLQASTIQSLLNPGDDGEQRALEAAGFDRLATLEYMQRSVPRGAAPVAWPDDVNLEPYDQALRPSFIQALDMTYEQTQDCPALHGMRDTDDVLVGHMAAGVFAPELWLLVRVAGEIAGVMLLNRIPAQGCVELVYFGLSPAVRGRGLARLLLQHGLWLCAKADCGTMTLAVDRDNAPAVRLYQACGFYRIARKDAWIMAHA